MLKKTSILIIYSGGTIGMARRPEDDTLVPIDFRQITAQVPELKRFGFNISAIAFEKPIDSSDVSPLVWKMLCRIIRDNYEKYDGFVILHGTDTMSYSASALSFMLEGLDKAVIFTGSQLPIGTLRTDGKENLITSIEIAAARKRGKPIVPEVCVYFEYTLYRGNRTTKNNSEMFDAYRSNNFPCLAEAGVHINYRHERIIKPDGNSKLKIHTKLDYNIASLQLFPGISRQNVETTMSIPGLQAIVLLSYGSGNAPSSGWFLDLIEDAVEREIIVLNITQCRVGIVNMEQYATGRGLLERGVVSGHDLTFEAAVCKLMFLLGRYSNRKKQKELLGRAICGELSIG